MYVNHIQYPITGLFMKYPSMVFTMYVDDEHNQYAGLYMNVKYLNTGLYINCYCMLVCT